MGAAQLIKINVEELVIEELAEYKKLSNRLRILNKQSIGMGMSMEFTNPDDKLKDLHSKLKPLASYMYLSKKEQALEAIAHTYLPRYALGTKSQLEDIKNLVGNDEEDAQLLKILKMKIQSVHDSRRGDTGDISNFDKTLDRMCEIQQIHEDMHHVESVFEIMDERKDHYVTLLKMRFIEEEEIEQVMHHLSISRAVFFRWRTLAISQYASLSGLN